MYSVMKQIVSLSMLLVAGALLFSSCDYREFAPAEYPDPILYFPAAIDGVWEISSIDKHCSYSEDGSKIQIHLAVAVSGVERKDFHAELGFAPSAVNKMIDDGSFPVGVLPLPEGVCSWPEDLLIPADGTSVLFDLEVRKSYLKDPEFLGRKFAAALKVYSGEAETNPAAETLVVLIDPAFLF